MIFIDTKWLSNLHDANFDLVDKNSNALLERLISHKLLPCVLKT